MTKEDKELLLKDLCARLPYHPQIHICNDSWEGCRIGEFDNNMWFHHVEAFLFNRIEILPYLRPMSSMTEEEFEKLKEYSGLKYEQLDLASYQNGTYKCLDFYLSEVPSYVVILVFDWLNANHFDYRGLIEKGLAISVTKENNPYKD